MSEDAGAGGPHQFDLLVVPGFSMLALCAVIEPIRLANQLLGRMHYRWRLIGAEGGVVRSSSGLGVPAEPLPAHGAARDADRCILVVAGFDPWPQGNAALKRWLRAADRRGIRLGAVDTGAFVLAAAEVLGRGPVALHWESADAFAELFPDIALSRDPVQIDARRLSCAGGVAAADMMLALIGESHGGDIAARVGRRLLIGRAAGSAAAAEPAAEPAASDPALAAVIRLMDERIESTASIEAIAAAARISRRTLERWFRQRLGRTPRQVYLARRLEHARRLLRHSDLPVREVALACGFASLSYFCRAYRQHFAVTPGGDRRLDPALVAPEVALAAEAPVPRAPLVPRRQGLARPRKRQGAPVP